MILSIYNDLLFYNYYVTMNASGRVNIFHNCIGSLADEVTL